jgi:hypothetical protein
VSSARVSVSFLATPSSKIDGTVQVVNVSTPTRADKQRLQALGLDLTESGDANSIDVVLYGDADVQLLRRNKFRYTVRIADLQQRNEANRRADRRYRLRVAQAGSQLPSGSTAYRRLPDFELELSCSPVAIPTWSSRSRCPTAPTWDATFRASRSPPTPTTCVTASPSS